MGFSMSLYIFFFFSCLWVLCYCIDDQKSDEFFYTYDNFTYSDKLKHYDWSYTKVELPPWFTSTTITLDSNVDLDRRSINTSRKIELPIICFRDGGPPLPDVSKRALEGLVLDHFFNGSVEGIDYLQNVGQCYPLQKKITLTFTNEQISPGALYVGLFNGIGPIRTQSKMINRGSAYFVRASISVEGCRYVGMGGQYCNQTIDQLSCAQSDLDEFGKNPHNIGMYNQLPGSVVACRNHLEATCLQDLEPKIYSLDLTETAEQLAISATDMRINGESSVNNIWDSNGTRLMCYARYNAIPKETLYDYSIDLSKAPLVIYSPKVGSWYFTIQPVSMSNVLERTPQTDISICYSMKWEVLGCPQGKAGPNCTMERHILQAVPRENSAVPFVYLPDHANVSLESPNFPLEPLLTNISFGDESNLAWTYFLVDIPQDSSGRNIHVQLLSDAKINYEIYARIGGLPSLSNWDYYYLNHTSNSNNGSMFKLYDSREERINIYIFYAREGLWSFGLRHPVYRDGPSPKTTMSVSIKSCPNRCSGHGTCRHINQGDYRYCACNCDSTHGGFDCSVELVSQAEQRWHSICLIASNAAAILPALWALRKKAFSEWVIFICSGLASGLYHACDVGTWCVLSFQVLQFMDFWLSFMAVVSTFVYLAVINEAAKRTIHTIAWILTALMAITGPTKSRNIVYVISIGAISLFVGWLIEFWSAYKSNSFSPGSCLNILQGWKNAKAWFLNLMQAIYKRFRWGFVLGGFIALSMAGLSWILETSQTYWIWHSTWHVSIYTSSIFFLCSKAAIVKDDNYQVVEDTSSASTSV